MKKATRQQSKDHNTSLVIKTIYQAKVVSRADIARATALTRPTVSAIVGDLIDMGLVAETGQGQSLGGKPPTLLEVDKNAWRILCVDIGNQEFRAALVNLRGEIMERAAIAAGNPTGEETLQTVYQLIDEMMSRSNVELLGIGVGTPGVIDPSDGIIRQAVNLGWKNLPLRQLLQDRYDKPIHLANDSQAAALGEFAFGATRDSQHLLLIKMGQGVGAGIIINGELFYGDGFSAGEIGHVVVGDGDPPATLEAIASTRTLLREAQRVAGPQMDWEKFVEGVASGSEELTQIVAEAGHYLGIAIAHLIAAFNIRNVVISGRVTQLGSLLRESAYQTAAKRALPMMVEDTHLAYSTLGTDIVLLGCSSLILKYELGIV